MNGAALACEVLTAHGIRHVFGLPGTQNVRLYEALRRGGLRAVVAADEGGAAFMAAGHARATGNVAVVTTIPGPGFVYALAGIAEALHDSTPVLWLTLRPEDTGRAFELQRIDQAAIAAPLVKRCFLIDRAELFEPTLNEALALTTRGEPGPVLVEVAAHLLEAELDAAFDAGPGRATAAVPDSTSAWAMLAAATRPVIFAGQGAQGAASAVRALAHRWRAPVVFTSSGRGVLDDTDPLALVEDFSTGLGSVVPELLERADLILALGCKFTHNGSAGGRLDLPRDKLVRVDASSEVLAANYPAQVAVTARVEDWLATVPLDRFTPSQWPDDEIAALRARLAVAREVPIEHEPSLVGAARADLRGFFDAIATAAGANAIYTTDAGLHQALTRRYATVRRPRGLLCPSDFQSMGFGLPAAIGAALAHPDACVLACVGDAGLMLSLGDLATAVREGIDLVVVVFNDGAMNLIRRQQVTTFGHESAVHVLEPDYAALCAAVGCSYFQAQGSLDELGRRVVATPGVRLVELRLQNVPSLHRRQLQAMVRERVRPFVPDGFWRVLKGALRR
jgi:acetolactate synthase-1/2/3 large subunit